MSRPYPAYKHSGIEWLGEIPSHWSVDRLKWSTEAPVNGVWGSEPDGEADIACIRVADFDRQAFKAIVDQPTYRAVPPAECRRRLLKAGDLLIEKSGGGEKQLVGAVVEWGADISAVTSNFVAKMACRAGMFPRFWTYVHAHLYAGRVNYPSIKQTTGIQNLDAASYLSERVAYPPEAEQVAIADFLDRETERIDGLVEKKRRLLALLEEKRLAVITRAVTKGLNPNVPMKGSGTEWLGQIPAHWSLARIANIQKLITYGFTNPMPTEDEGPFMLTANDVDYGTIRYETARRTSQEAFDRFISEKSRPKRDDILLTKDGTLGRVAIHDGQPVCINQSVALVRLNQEVVVPEFVLFCLMSSAYQDMMLFDAGGTTIKHIYITRFAKMPFAFPDLNEQAEILAYLKSRLCPIEDTIVASRRSIGFLSEYRSALITNAVTGKIDVRGEVAKEAAA